MLLKWFSNILTSNVFQIFEFEWFFKNLISLKMFKSFESQILIFYKYLIILGISKFQII